MQIDLCKLLSLDWLKLWLGAAPDWLKLWAGASLIRSVYGRKEVDYYMFIVILSDNKEGIWMRVCLIHLLTHPPCSLVKC